ncbi:Uncharacterised protein [Segatella copri]|nr:Uncharacterised protein [Segatella copri]
MSAKDISKHREDVVHVHAGTTAESAESTLWPVETKLVILLALLGIVENFVSFGSFLEFLFRLFVARVAVWMILNGYLSIRLLYFVF